MCPSGGATERLCLSVLLGPVLLFLNVGTQKARKEKELRVAKREKWSKPRHHVSSQSASGSPVAVPVRMILGPVLQGTH